MSKIFISYRRDDSSGYAGRLYDRLKQHFGKDRVFMDIDHIEPGEDFVELINEKVHSCTTLIALIGQHWLNATDRTGTRRLDIPEDLVRLEITSALSGKVRVMARWPSPCSFRCFGLAVAEIAMKYDVYGNLTQMAFFGKDDRLVAPKTIGAAIRTIAYDEEGNIVENSSLAKFKYDYRGNRTEAAYFDKNERLTLLTEGYARMQNKYSDNGVLIEQVYSGLNDATPAQKLGFTKMRWTLDEFGKVRQLAYYGVNDQLARTPLGYATIRFSYDSLGRENKREFFDVDDKAVHTNVTVDKIELGSNAERADLQIHDLILTYDGQTVPNTHVFYELELMRGEDSRALTVQRNGTVLTFDIPPGRLRGIELIDKSSRKTGTALH